MSYPEPLYHGETGLINAALEPAGRAPEVRYPAGGTAHYLATGESTGGQFGLYRWEMAAAQGGPGPHFHRSISESFYVLSGAIQLYDGARWIDGEPGDFLFLVTAGEVAVRVATGGGLEREVARLGAGDFFGEMSLMTGERRSATVTAATPVECYLLDKAAFETVLRGRPAVAEPLAEVLAHRRVELLAARDGLDQEARSRQVAAAQVDLLRRIRDFFGLQDDGRHHV